MRLAVVHNLLRGGARTRLENQLRHLDADVTEFVLGTANPVTDSPVVVPFREAAGRVPAPLRPALRHTDLVRLLAAWRRLARAVDRGGFDAVFAGPCQFLQAPAALRWTTAPALYFCDEPRRIDYDPALRSSLNPRTEALYAGLRRARRRADRAAVARADVLACNSAFSAAAIRAAYGVDATPVRLGAAPVFHGTPRPRGEHLLSVGTLIATKGHELVVDAAGRTATRWPVVVVAPRPDPSAEAALRSRAVALGVDLRIRTGIPIEELAALYRGAQATVYLAAREPLGLVSLEAQASGCPVVVADEGGLPETVSPGRTGWAVPRDAAAAAAAIDRLEDPRLRAAAGAAAIDWARGWSWDASAGHVRSLLAAL